MSSAPADSRTDKVTVTLLRRMKERGERVSMLTCYDYPSARLLDEAGTDILLTGDSLGDNVLGYANTIPVTLDEIIHHARAVKRGASRAMVMADLPFLTYQISVEEAMRSAGRLLKEAQVEAVKLEGGAEMASTIRRMVDAGIAVMGHVGFTPQSVNVLGGYRKLGRDDESAERILQDAREVADAGAFAIVLELIPPELAKKITDAVPIPTIGIGAGPHCDGQVQVFHDLLGLSPDRSLRHVKRYAELGRQIIEAAATFREDVRSGRFDPENRR